MKCLCIHLQLNIIQEVALWLIMFQDRSLRQRSTSDGMLSFRRCKGGADMVRAALAIALLILVTVSSYAGDNQSRVWVDREHDYRIEIRKKTYLVCQGNVCESGRLKYNSGGSLLLIKFRKSRIGNKLMQESGQNRVLASTAAGRLYPESLIFPAILREAGVCRGRDFIELGEFDGMRYIFCATI